jgi:hypothetical protein
MIHELVDSWNGLFDRPVADTDYQYFEEAANIYKEGLLKQYTSQNPYDYVRVSNLGKPGLDIHAHRLYPEWFSNDKTERLIQLFHAGDTFEADFYFHLKRFGYTILATQVEINYRGILGHTDMVVYVNKSPCLLELKTCAANRFNLMSKGQKNMPLTYLTQMAVYQKELNIPAYWVLYNKDNSDIELVPYTPCLETLARVDYLIDSLNEVVTWKDAYDWFNPPPPEAEKFQGSLTGNFKVPQCVDKQLAPHIYEIVETLNNYKKMTCYVTHYKNWDGSLIDLEDV